LVRVVRQDGRGVLVYRNQNSFDEKIQRRFSKLPLLWQLQEPKKAKASANGSQCAEKIGQQGCYRCARANSALTVGINRASPPRHAGAKMNRFIRSIANPVLDMTTRLARRAIAPELRELRQSEQQIQRCIANQYIEARQQGHVPYVKINEAGFRAYSQFEEDGILLYIFSMIGFRSRKVVELCCGTGDESMSANLIINHGCF